MKNLTLFSVLFILVLSLNAQTTPPTIQWQKCLGGTGSDAASSIGLTNDGGYIITGWSTSNDSDVTGHHGTSGTSGNCDYWCVKVDSVGNIQWQKSLGGSSNDKAYSTQKTIDGGYIIAGTAASNNGDVTGNHGSDFWIVKLDSSGNIQWQKAHGGTGSETAYSIQQTTDRGYIVAGTSFSNDSDVTGHHGLTNLGDYWVVKLDTIGNIQWQKSLGGTKNDIAQSVQQTLDGGYIVAGYSGSNDGDVTGHHGPSNSTPAAYDYWIVKLDTIGNIQWQKSLGGDTIDMAYSVQQTIDRGYIIAGNTYSNNGDISGNHGGWWQDSWIVKLDTAGNIQWQKCFGGTGGDQANSIKQTTDGGYIFTGATTSNNGNVSGNHDITGNTTDYWLVKLDTSGNIQWQKCLGGTNYDRPLSVEQTVDVGFIVAGWTVSNNGDVSNNHDTTGNSEDYWIVKLGFTTGLHTQKPTIKSDVTIYPNPSQSKFKVNIPNDTKILIISNSLGQLIEKRIVSNQTVLSFDIKGNGIYFIQVITDNVSITRKIIINNY
jgi:hypothetical protein